MMISPPAWGWPAHSSGLALAESDFPTRVGMARTGSSSVVVSM